MRLFSFACVAAVALTSAQVAHATSVILFEDFEDSTLTYTSNLADALGDVGSRDYYGRITPGLLPSDIIFANQQGAGFYGAQDTDGATGGGGATLGVDLVQLDWTGIDVSAFTSLALSWFVAEDDSADGNEDWDTNTSFQISAQLDGGGFNAIFAIESEDGGGGDLTNEAPRVDTDFDGVGDGAEITDSFTQFSTNLADASTLDIRVQLFGFNAGDEDIALDNILLTGTSTTAVPAPPAVVFSLSAFALFGATVRRQRRRKS